MNLLHGDCLNQLQNLEDNSVEAIITDPPYGLSFMGKKWDYDVPSVEIWKEAYRVLKPGGHLLSFSGTRTYHRMTVNIEDAGFEIRDMIEWVYGSGFPKSLNIGKAVDKLLGNEREVVGRKETQPGLHRSQSNEHFTDDNWKGDDEEARKITKGTSEWEGWGTALKPAHEPICVARKPLSEKNIAENVLKHGTGGLNVDGSRVSPSQNDRTNYGLDKELPRANTTSSLGKFNKVTPYQRPEQGRFPANLVHDNSDEVLECFPESSVSGAAKKNAQSTKSSNSHFGNSSGQIKHHFINDQGSAACFFKSIIYQAKASKAERNRGLEGMEAKPVAWGNQAKAELKRGNTDFKADGDATKHNKVEMRVNHHPTVKPVALMEYLVNMFTKEGQTVLDPFMGSGTTGVACKNLNLNFIGIELDEEYFHIAKKRIEETQPPLLQAAE